MTHLADFLPEEKIFMFAILEKAYAANRRRCYIEITNLNYTQIDHNVFLIPGVK